jgi:protein associated with RNAse G/E
MKQESEDQPETVLQLLQIVKTDNQVYFIALSSFAARQGLNEQALKALKLDLRTKVIQNELIDLLSESDSTLKLGRAKMVQSLY